MDAPFKKEQNQEIGLDMRAGNIRRRPIMPESIDKRAKKNSSATPRRRSGDLGWHSPIKKEDVAETTTPSLRAKRDLRMMPKPKALKEKKQYTKVKRPGAPKSIKFKANEKRNCIVKVDFRQTAKGNGNGSNKQLISARLAPFMASKGGSVTGARVGYIKREDAIEGVLFTARGNELVGFTGDEATFLFQNDPTLTIILSPEDKGADLVELTRSFMRDIYSAHTSSMPRFWCAAIHGNTEHRHVHIIASCLGSDGKSDAKIHSSYVHSRKLKEDVSTLLTLQQGYRSWLETSESIRKKKNRLFSQPIDELMLKNAVENEDGYKTFILSSLKTQGQKDKASRRLQILKKAGYVEKGDGIGVWRFLPNTEAKLRQLDFVEAFGLTEKELSSMILDSSQTPTYSGTIIETAIKGGEENYAERVKKDSTKTTAKGKKKETKSVMLFLIKDFDGKLHLRREYITSENDKKEKESLTTITASGYRGMKSLLTLQSGRAK